MKQIRKTRIVCTIGPASSSARTLESLIRAGMNVARLNFSHGSHAGHLKKLRQIRRLSRNLARPVAIMQDLSGPKIRTGELSGGEVLLRSGSRICLTGRQVQGNAELISISYPALAREVRLGDTILLSDGAIELRVEQKKDRDVYCRVVVGGMLGSRKGVNIPSESLSIPSLTRRDRADLKFGLAHGVDLIALSFVRRAEDIHRLKRVLRRQGRDIPVIAKIEKPEAVDRIDEILSAAWGLMVARGDLGVEIPLEDVPAVQKLLIKKANAAGKPVITATQMLRSMVESPAPTRAEVADVANAIYDGTDAVMLSEETAIGRYPVQAVRMMDRISRAAERAQGNSAEPRPAFRSEGRVPDAISYSAYLMAHNLKARAIITPTRSGYTARLISRYRPEAELIALSPSKDTVQRLALVWGVEAFHVPELEGSRDLMSHALKTAQRIKRFRKGELVVVTAGLPLKRAGITNSIRLERV
jgi:pyruvate kinase